MDWMNHGGGIVAEPESHGGAEGRDQGESRRPTGPGGLRHRLRSRGVRLSLLALPAFLATMIPGELNPSTENPLPTFGWLGTTGAAAQVVSPGLSNGTPMRVRVFLDCQARNCDRDHFRTEIGWVNWVVDRADADLHVIFTSESVGGGGNRYSFDFLGLRGLAGRDDRLTYTEAGSDVRAETLDGLAQTLRLGLLRYAVEVGQGGEFSLDFLGSSRDHGMGEATDDDSGEAPPDPFRDPWNAWTFRVGMSGNMDLQERRTEHRLNPTLSANRVTDDWKVNVSVWANHRRQRITLSDGRVVRNDTDSWRVGGLLVRSVTDHVSLGFDTSARNALTQNQRQRLTLRPAIEWNYFPYAVANRRQFIAHYGVGFEYSNYIEPTVFGALRETLPTHRFAFQYRVRETWGNAGVGFESAQYLHDRTLFSFGLSGEVSYRISRGLDLNLSGDASRVNDQIHVPASNFSDEDILLGRVNLPSGYRYQASVGFGYRWGSTSANVVNNRFPGSVR